MGEVDLDRVARLVLRRLIIVSVGAVVVGTLWLVAATTMVGAADEPVQAGELFGPATGQPTPLTASERGMAVERLRAATALVSATGCGAKTIGTGFAVDDVVMTNSHVVGDADRFQVDQPAAGSGPSSFQVPVSMRSPAIDVAAGSVADVGLGRAITTQLRWAERPAVAGEVVLVAGYGGGRKLTILEAAVHAVVDGSAYGNDGLVLLIDRAVTAGFSGGPVVGRDGRVVGMIRAYDSVTGLSIATPTSELVAALTDTALTDTALTGTPPASSAVTSLDIDATEAVCN